MSDIPPSSPEDDGHLIRAFEARHSGLALAWRLIKRRPIVGGITALIFVIASTIILETSKAANTLFNRWAEQAWYAPYETHVRMQALKAGNEYILQRALHTGDWVTSTKPLRFYAVENGNSPPPNLMEMDEIQSNDPDVLSRDPESIGPGKKIMPMFDAQQQLAVTDGYAYAFDGDIWGLIPLDDYRTAALPEKDSPQ